MASTVLTRTPSSNGSQRIMTFSTWLKRGDLGISNAFFSTGSNSSNVFAIYFTSEFASGKADSLQMEYYNGSTNYYIRTNRKFRDTSAWYHIVGVLDTTDATQSNRMRLYVNNLEETSFDASAYPTQNFDVQYLNSTSYQNNVGNYVGGSYFGGSLAHTHFIDGTVYSPSDFGETDATTGIWKPKTAPSVTYGTNGFFLKFENSGAFGTDSSGNANNFTVNGTMTQTIDTPSNVFSTLNPLSRNAGTFANGNTSQTGGNDIASTIGVTTGKWYWEVKRANSTNSFHTGICNTNKGMSGASEQFLNGEANSIGGAIYINESSTGTLSYSNGAGFSSVTYNSFGTVSISSGDILGFALDLDSATKRLDVYQNGSSIGNVTFSYDEQNPIFVYSRMNTGVTADFNFGNGYFGTTAVASAQNPDDGIGIFEYSVPTGYKALCTKSINAQEYD